MEFRVTRKPEVRRDLLELANHISGDSLEAGLRFFKAAEMTFSFLSANREAGQLCHFAHPETAGLRVWPIEGFRNYLVFYRPTDQGVVVERVLHGARDIEGLFAEGG